ncbi:MAG TPA: P-loop NTPase fold protein, partial [Anaerolineae bacterium]|nr:P-loop NTPase fold protein [Anaerolineae bacterium]
MTEMNPLLPMLSDQPAEDDRLNFDPYAKTLAEIVSDPTTRTPLTIGVFGDWGYGKTSLMQMVRKRLRATEGTDFPVQAVWFNAWLYSREQALWRALIARVLAGARQFLTLAAAQLTQLERLESRLYQAAEVENGALTLPPDVIPELPSASLPARAGLELWRRQALRQETAPARVQRVEELIADVEASYALTQRARLVALDDFRDEFESLSKTCVAPHGRLVVFVDDLDRCLPDKAVEVLEAIKLFLDAPGFIFVLGLDRAVIEEGIRVRYKEYATQIEGARYLEKIIQLPFNLPPIDAHALTDYIHNETAGTLPDPRCETVFGVGLEPNPRRIKRTLNVFLLLWRLAQNREELHAAIQPVRLAKIVIIQQYYPRLFALIAQGPHYLIDLEKRFRETRGGEGEMGRGGDKGTGRGGEG